MECTVAALDAGLSGTYMVWLSSSFFYSPAIRFTKQGKFVNTAGQTVANSWADLTDGSLQNPINYDEYGNIVNSYAVTGTTPDGGPAPEDRCNDWYSGDYSALAAIGHTADTNSDWSFEGPLYCTDVSHRIYCFEQ
jgi:hypothetical protein